jgi:hypothetical protein
MDRRRFLQLPLATAAHLELRGSARAVERASELACDLLVVGAGTGGCAAALAAARAGLRVILTEETDWVGGQLTAQAVPPDEHLNPWIDAFTGTRSYREMKARVRDYYRRNYPLTAEARALPNLNPGNGSVGGLCCEPRVVLAVLEEMLAPFAGGGRLRVLLEHRARAADVAGDRVRAVTLESRTTGRRLTVAAPLVVDGTETGELLPLTRTEYVTGAESREQTGEPHAAPAPQPLNMQAFTCCFAMEYREGEDHTIDRPEEYPVFRDLRPELRPAWPGRLLSFTVSHYKTRQPYTYRFDPLRETRESNGLWLYRRIADRRNFVPGAYPGDITLVNWDQNDYFLGNLYEVPEEEARRNLRRAKQLSLSLLYWLQTEGPRPDGRLGWPELRLRPDIVGTEDGLAKQPYVRESRRIKAEFTPLEQHIATEARMRLTGKPRSEVVAERFPDSVGLGSYSIDLHPTTGGDNFLTLSSLPFQIPLGALIPVRTENLLAAAKNIGTTHLTNGCFRLHPEEWNIGESAGTLAALCVTRKLSPRQVRNTAKLLGDFQGLLRSQGVTLEWPRPGPSF